MSMRLSSQEGLLEQMPQWKFGCRKSKWLQFLGVNVNSVWQPAAKVREQRGCQLRLGCEATFSVLLWFNMFIGTREEGQRRQSQEGQGRQPLFDITVLPSAFLPSAMARYQLFPGFHVFRRFGFGKQTRVVITIIFLCQSFSPLSQHQSSPI